MRFILISSRIQAHFSRFSNHLLNNQKLPSIITYSYTNCMTGGQVESGLVYINRPGMYTVPVFPEHLFEVDGSKGLFKGYTSTGSINISPHEIVIVTVLSANEEDAGMLCLHALSEVSKLI